MIAMGELRNERGAEGQKSERKTNVPLVRCLNLSELKCLWCDLIDSVFNSPFY